MAVMDEAGNAILINDHLGRHAAKFEQVDFLAVQPEHAGLWIRQANKGQIMFVPISLKCLRILRSDHQNLSLPLRKFLKVLTQLRHMSLAKWSDKTTIEYQQEVGLSFKTGKLDRFSLEIRQSEIGSGGV